MPGWMSSCSTTMPQSRACRPPSPWSTPTGWTRTAPTARSAPPGHAPWPGQAADAPVHTALLYPATAPDPQLPLLAPPVLPGAWLAQPQQLRLVVLDGTWRKSRKMLYLNPALQQLPRLALHDVPAGRYVIRKAHAPGQLSSFEAAALALAQLHSWSDRHPAWLALMQSFDHAMAHHQQLQAQHRAKVQPPEV